MKASRRRSPGYVQLRYRGKQRETALAVVRKLVERRVLQIDGGQSTRHRRCWTPLLVRRGQRRQLGESVVGADLRLRQLPFIPRIDATQRNSSDLKPPKPLVEVRKL